MPLKKWYFATNVHGLHWAFNQIRGAVLSAKAQTTLLPHAIIDDSGSDNISEERIAWLEEQGVKIIRHRASLVEELLPVFGDVMNIYSGHWLRCDIPQIEQDDEFIIYTDIDVIFEAEISDIMPSPRVLACAPEHNRGDYSYFNSGVMVINVPAFASHRQRMVEVLRSRLSSTAPYDDQNMLNELFVGKWDHLSDFWNWKPYWGHNANALIVHWHGPKPNHVVEMLEGETSKFGPDYETIFKKDPASYQKHLERFSRY